MTPKEKAKELVDKFKNYSWMSDIEGCEESSINESAKQCTLIAVDEIIAQIEPSVSMDVISSRIKYWQEVKTEIEKL